MTLFWTKCNGHNLKNKSCVSSSGLQTMLIYNLTGLWNTIREHPNVEMNQSRKENVIIGINCELKVWNNSRVCPRLALVNSITELKTLMNGLYRRFLTFWIQKALRCPTQYLKAVPQNLGVLIYYFNHNSVCNSRSFNNCMFFSKKQ